MSYVGDDKVVIVTGASKGLGRAMATGFAESGAHVVVSGRDAQASAKLAADLESQTGNRCVAISCHVGEWDACERLVLQTLEEFGRIDLLVNNAGIAPVPPSLEGITEALFDKTIAVNLKGPLRLTGLVAPHLPPGGSVINVSSKASLRPTPFTMVYAAAKAGLNVLTQAAAQELGPRGIRVNAIVCGPFHSESFDKAIPTKDLENAVAGSIALRRIADPQEVVGTALFLASDAASYMTGALLSLDGGGS